MLDAERVLLRDDPAARVGLVCRVADHFRSGIKAALRVYRWSSRWLQAGGGVLQLRTPLTPPRRFSGDLERASARATSNAARVLLMAQAPLSEDGETKFVGVKFVDTQLAELDELAARRSVKRSVLVREAVEALLAADKSEAATG